MARLLPRRCISFIHGHHGVVRQRKHVLLADVEEHLIRHKAAQPVLGRVFLRLVDPGGSPVGAAVILDVALLALGLHDLQERTYRNRDVVTVIEVDVDAVHAERLQAELDVALHVLFAHTRGVHVVQPGMSALGDENEVVMPAPAAYPFTQYALAPADLGRDPVGIDPRGVYDISAHVEICLDDRVNVGGILLLEANVHRAVANGEKRKLRSGKFDLFYCHDLSFQSLTPKIKKRHFIADQRLPPDYPL